MTEHTHLFLLFMKGATIETVLLIYSPPFKMSTMPDKYTVYKPFFG